jgi:hypothetical protein
MSSNLRKDSMTGVIEYEGLSKVNLHFSEWWNGEGLDIEFGEEEKRIHLHTDEIHALVVAFVATGMVDMNEVNEHVDRMKFDSLMREESIKRIRNSYA